MTIDPEDAAADLRLAADVVALLDGHFAAADVFVGGCGLPVFYDLGNLGKFVSPDVFLVRGVRRGPRDQFRTWTEGRFPTFVLEVTGRATQFEDVDTKFRTYRDVWRVQEYFLFDPRGDYLTPPILAYRWEGRSFEPIEPEAGQYPSEALGLIIEAAGDKLTFRRPDTGLPLVHPDVERRRLEDAAAAAFARVAALEQQVRWLIAQHHGTRAEVDRLRAELAALKQPPVPAAPPVNLSGYGEAE